MVSRCMVIVDWLSTKMGKIKSTIIKSQVEILAILYDFSCIISHRSSPPHIIHLFLSFKNI